MAKSLASLRRSMGERAPGRITVVHRASPGAPPTRVLAPGIEALNVADFVSALGSAKRGVRNAHRSS
jgi:hypothetical protein